MQGVESVHFSNSLSLTFSTPCYSANEYPPLTGTVWPVIQLAASEARNKIMFAASCGSPKRRIVYCLSIRLASSSLAMARSVAGVRVVPSATQFAVIV